jgi:hypothetical protein
MHVERQNNTATLLGDGRVLIVGGFDQPRRALASAEIYDPASGKFTTRASPLVRLAAVASSSGRNLPVELRLAPTANKEPPILVGMVRRAARAGLAAHVSDITSSNAHGGAQAEDRDDGRDERGTSG